MYDRYAAPRQNKKRTMTRIVEKTAALFQKSGICLKLVQLRSQCKKYKGNADVGCRLIICPDRSALSCMCA